MKSKIIFQNLRIFILSVFLVSGLMVSCGSLNNSTSLAEYDGIYDDEVMYIDPPAEVVVKEVEPNYFSLEYDRLTAYENEDFFTDIEGYSTPYENTYSQADSLPGNYTISEPWGHESAQKVSVNVYNTGRSIYINPYFNGFYQFGFWGYNPYFNQYWGGGIYPPFWTGGYYPPYYRPPYWGGGIYPPYYRPPYYGGGYYGPNYRPYYRNNVNYYYGKRGTTRPTNSRMSYTADYRKRSSYASNSKTSRNQTRKSSTYSRKSNSRSKSTRANRYDSSRSRNYNNQNGRSPSRNYSSPSYSSPSYSSPRSSPSANPSYSPRRSGGSSSRGGGVRRGGGRQSASFTPSKSISKSYRSKTTIARSSYSKSSKKTTVLKRKSKY